MQTLFSEKQNFASWVYWLVFATALLPICILIVQVVGGKPIGDNPMSNTGLVIWILVTLLITFLFMKLQLRTEINNDRIKIKFTPFTNRDLRWTEVSKADVLNYGFVGGWGVRLHTKYGTVYNTKGNIGLAIELKNGKKLCVGTQREEELRAVMESIKRDQGI